MPHSNHHINNIMEADVDLLINTNFIENSLDDDIIINPNVESEDDSKLLVKHEPVDR